MNNKYPTWEELDSGAKKWFYSKESYDRYINKCRNRDQEQVKKSVSVEGKRKYWYCYNNYWLDLTEVLTKYPNKKLADLCVDSVPYGQGECCFDDDWQERKSTYIKYLYYLYHDEGTSNG